MLPQLLPVADEDFLREFATEVFFDKEFPECADKTHVVPTLLTTAIYKAKFYNPKPAQSRASYLYPYRHEPEPAVVGDLEKAKKYVQLCFDVECTHLLGNVLDRVMNASGLSALDAQEYAKSVMFPLATFVTEQMCLNPAIGPIPQLENLRSTMTKFFLDGVEKNPSSFNKREIARLLSMCVVDGNPTIFMTL